MYLNSPITDTQLTPAVGRQEPLAAASGKGRLLFFLLFSFLFISTSAGLHAQRDSSGLAKKLAEYQIKGSVGLQLWSTYSMNGRVFDASLGRFSEIGNRLNTQIRRSRFTLTGRPYPTVSFKITAALDLVGLLEKQA